MGIPAPQPQSGAMGIHYVNSNFLKDSVTDIANRKPSCEPRPMARWPSLGRIHASGTAALEGQLFNFNSAPNRYGLDPFYELHVWAWKPNSTGHFADNNPDVSCNAAKASISGAGWPATSPGNVTYKTA
jgi:hypothetical protein